MAAAGGQATPVPHLTRRDDGDFFYRWPSFLPDGRHFLYLPLPRHRTRQAGSPSASLDSPDRIWVDASDSGAALRAAGYLFYRAGNGS